MNNMKGKFYIKTNNEIKYKIEYSLKEDSSLMVDYYFGNYELLLGNGYHIAIGINKESGECLSVCCLLDALSFEKKDINFLVEDNEQYALIYTSTDLYNGAGEHYVPFERKCYYDSTKSILAFGNIYDEAKIISFNSNTFAKLKNDELLALYIKVSHDVIFYIENRKQHRIWNKLRV